MLLLFSCSVVSDSVTPWTAARQASPSFTVSRSLLKLMSIESVMASSHLILCRPLPFLPSIFPSIKVFSSYQFFSSGGQCIGPHSLERQAHLNKHVFWSQPATCRRAPVQDSRSSGALDREERCGEELSGSEQPWLGRWEGQSCVLRCGSPCFPVHSRHGSSTVIQVACLLPSLPILVSWAERTAQPG